MSIPDYKPANVSHALFNGRRSVAVEAFGDDSDTRIVRFIRDTYGDMLINLDGNEWVRIGVDDWIATLAALSVYGTTEGSKLGATRLHIQGY